jgi:ribonuclease HII
MAVIVPTLRYERRFWNDGLVRVVGVDEVGVAPTCGAVVAAAVIMRPGCHRIPGVRDSKTLSAAQRERLAPLIRARAVAVGVGAASVREIDQLNIYHATHLAMRRAIARVGGHEHVLVDGNRIAGFEAQVGPYTNIVDGDAKVYSIACASVVAKVVRDRMMERLAVRYPGYGWEHNQGYATRDHRDAIRAMGLTPFHRRSFLALQRTLAGDQLELDLLADPAASPETHDRLERELIPVMADDATLDALDLVALERSPAGA